MTIKYTDKSNIDLIGGVINRKKVYARPCNEKDYPALVKKAKAEKIHILSVENHREDN